MFLVTRISLFRSFFKWAGFSGVIVNLEPDSTRSLSASTESNENLPDPKAGFPYVLEMEFESLVRGYGLIEGPRVDPDGALYFSDVLRGGVYRRAPDGAIETIVPRRRGVGGIALHADGGIVISGRNICHVRGGETRVLFEREDIPGFNDLYTDEQGRVYTGSMMSDPFSTKGERAMGECFRIDAPGRAEVLYGDVSLTNGIGILPGGRTLVHADTARQQIIAHELDDAGRASARRVFASVEGGGRGGGPDGLAVDVEGGVWVAVYGAGAVHRYAPDGSLDRNVAVPARAVTSLCFGGEDFRDLYVVSADNTDEPDAEGCVFRTRSDVAGLPAPFARV
jgi:D-xylonolactonase